MGGPDALLAARLAAVDDHALVEIFDRLAPAVYGPALRVLGEGAAAQDVVQDVFVDLWSRPGRYAPEAGPLRTFLTVLARHRALDLVRSELCRVARQERHFRMAPGHPPPLPGDEVATWEAASLVRDAVQHLPGAQRRVLELAYFQGLTVRFRARSRGTGKTAAMDLHHFFRFRDGKIAYYRGTEDTAQTARVLPRRGPHS